jgi:hypothetical protein
MVYGNGVNVKYLYVTGIIQFKFKQNLNKSCYIVGDHVEARLLLCKFLYFLQNVYDFNFKLMVMRYTRT